MKLQNILIKTLPILILSLIPSTSYCAEKELTPQNDFYHFVNQDWLKTAVIPPDKNIYNTFYILDDKNDKELMDLIQNLSQEPANKHTAEMLNIIRLHQSFLAEACIEALGLSPLQPDLKAIDQIQSYSALLKVMAHLSKIGVSLPFALSVSQDMKQTNQYILGLSQSGLGLPDREYYLSSTPDFLKIQKSYTQHIAKLFSLANLDAALPRAQAVFDLEKALAKSHWTRVDSRDYDKIYNKYSIHQLSSVTPHIQWKDILQDFNIPTKWVKSMMVYQPSALTAFDTLLYKTPLDTWKNYLRWKLLSAYAAYLDHRFVDANFEFYGKQLNGLLEMKSRQKRAVYLVNDTLPDAIGQLYVERYFSANSKKQMEQLVANLKHSFKISLEQNTWMGDKTKQAALLKLSKLNTKIGYPSHWKSYRGLNFKTDTLIQNVMNSNQYEFNRDIKKLNKPVDRNEWYLPPQTVNAYYNPSMNEIVFPAAILQPPFFDPKASKAKNYGGIGAIIGHEISHAFDDQGRKFDEAGNLKNWWTPQDVERFTEYTKGLVKQYNQYEPIKGFFVNGELTLGENIADISGLSVAHHAFKQVESDKKQDKSFFISWAQVWRNKIRPEALQQRLLTDPHSPGIYRTNGVVKNIDAFYKTYDVKPTDKMYLPPHQRVNLWSFKQET